MNFVPLSVGVVYCPNMLILQWPESYKINIYNIYAVFKIGFKM